MQIRYRSVEDLIPYERNSRTHSDAQVDQVAASIKAYGFTNPILVGPDGVVIAGHGRLMAAQRLGLEQVPTIELSHLDESQRRAYVIADNKLAEQAGWDDELLALELGALSELGHDLSPLGFTEQELSQLLDDGPLRGLTEDDDVPEKSSHPVSEPGDIWVLGGGA